MQIPANVHVAIADGERFLVMRNSGTATEPRLELVAQPDLLLENQSAAVGHNDPINDDYGGQMKLDHAAAVADWLNREVLQHRIEQLIVVADPRTLGEIRQHYHGETEKALVGEVNKELTRMPGPDIVRALEAA